MKKNLIALAVASAIAAPVAMADAPVVYGQINVAVDSVTDEGMRTSDRDSRLGIKGSEDLGNGLKAVYKMEFGIKVGDAFGTTGTIDGGTDKAVTSSGISGRNAYVGLAGGFGTVLLGRHDTPLKMSQAKDLFGDSSYADMGKSDLVGKLGLSGKNGELRLDNVIAYVSPSFSGVKVVLAGVGAENGTNDASLTNAYSAAIMYGSTKKGLYLAAAVDHADDQIDADEWDHMRLSAQYKTGGLIANATYQTFKDGVSAKNTDEGTNTQFQLGYKMGKFMPKAKYSTTDFEATSKKDGSAYALGLNYSLGKKTTAYVEYVNSDKNLSDQSFTSVGMVHKF